MEEKVKKKLEQLLKAGKIDQQAFRTYVGQIESGNIEGCLKGMRRKRLIQKGADVL